MKKIVILATVLLSIIMTAHATFMNVEKSDHTIYSYDIDEIDQVSFSEESEGKIDPDTVKIEIPIAIPTVSESQVTDHVIIEVHDTTIVYVKVPKKNKTLYSGQIGEYDYVDLGLPSGTKWATCNVGAKQPFETGDYLLWRGTHPVGNNVKTGNNQSTDEKTDDSATTLWGEAWRTPTGDEITELIDGCVWEWTNNFDGTGAHGQIGTSKTNGNRIFFPAAGLILRNQFFKVGELGFYWSISLRNEGEPFALQFTDSYLKLSTLAYKESGKLVRPVVKNLNPTNENNDLNDETSQNTLINNETIEANDSIQNDTMKNVSYIGVVQGNLPNTNDGSTEPNLRLGLGNLFPIQSDDLGLVKQETKKSALQIVSEGAIVVLPTESGCIDINSNEWKQETETMSNTLTIASESVTREILENGSMNALDMGQETKTTDSILTKTTNNLATQPTESYMLSNLLGE